MHKVLQLHELLDLKNSVIDIQSKLIESLLKENAEKENLIRVLNGESD